MGWVWSNRPSSRRSRPVLMPPPLHSSSHPPTTNSGLGAQDQDQDCTFRAPRWTRTELTYHGSTPTARSRWDRRGGRGFDEILPQTGPFSLPLESLPLALLTSLGKLVLVALRGLAAMGSGIELPYWRICPQWAFVALSERALDALNSDFSLLLLPAQTW